MGEYSAGRLVGRGRALRTILAACQAEASLQRLLVGRGRRRRTDSAACLADASLQRLLARARACLARARLAWRESPCPLERSAHLALRCGSWPVSLVELTVELLVTPVLLTVELLVSPVLLTVELLVSPVLLTVELLV